MAIKKTALKAFHSKKAKTIVGKNIGETNIHPGFTTNTDPVDISPALQTAQIKVIITNAIPGTSTITATSDSQQQTIKKSGTITMTNIKKSEMIALTGTSIGNTTVTIDLDADPKQFNFDAGKINGSFFIN